MPKFFQLITLAIPARYFISLIRGIVLRGAGLVELREPPAALTGFTVLIIGLEVVPFKKTND